MRSLPSAHLPLALVASMPLVTSCADEPEPREPGEARHVILISLDTLRADACSLYGYEKETTPVLDALARERGIVFENHMVNSNNTLTSHATMLTGLLMMVHRAEDRGTEDTRFALAPEYETVAEKFQIAGYDTAAFTAHPVWLSPDFGLDQGFAHFETAWTQALDINERFIDWIDDEKPPRIFAFLHYYDAHSEGHGKLPYRAPGRYLERFAPKKPADFTGEGTNEEGAAVMASEFLDLYNAPDRDLPPEHIEWLRGCYDAGVAKLDDDLGQLFDALDDRGILDDSLIVITSDHGEEFEDHGGTLHSSFYDEIMHVPLVVVPPAGTPRPRPRVDDMSRCVDIPATLLDLAGLEPLELTQGRSFAPCVRGETLEYVSTFFGRSVLRARDETSNYKFVSSQDNPRFFDLESDPAEQLNLMQQPEFKRDSADRLLAISKAVRDVRKESNLLRTKIDASTGKGPAMTPDQIEALRALGYMGTGEEEADPDAPGKPEEDVEQ